MLSKILFVFSGDTFYKFIRYNFVKHIEYIVIKLIKREDTQELDASTLFCNFFPN